MKDTVKVNIKKTTFASNACLKCVRMPGGI